MDSQQSCKLAVLEQLDVEGGNTNAEHSSSHLPLSQMKPTELARPRAWWSRRTASGARETTCSKSRFKGEGTLAQCGTKLRQDSTRPRLRHRPTIFSSSRLLTETKTDLCLQCAGPYTNKRQIFSGEKLPTVPKEYLCFRHMVLQNLLEHALGEKLLSLWTMLESNKCFIFLRNVTVL